MRIPFVKAARARSLHTAGFRTVEAITRASQGELIEALKKAGSKQPWNEPMLCRTARLILSGALRLKSEDELVASKEMNRRAKEFRQADGESDCSSEGDGG